jgi:putative Mn2+ efflux pump MntP
MPREQEVHHHTRRDAATLKVLGTFITALAIPVLIGTIWATNFHAVVVNMLAGLILLGIGVAFIVRGRWTLRNLD